MIKLTTENFGALGPGKFSAEFDKGITAVVGQNGAGKSTLVEALYFALTGDTLRDSKIEDLITWGTDKLSVKLEINDITVSRIVTRDQPVKLSFKRGDISLNRKAEIEVALLNAFGLTEKSAYSQVYFSTQFTAVDILNGPDSGRLAMLTNLFGLAKLEKVRTKLQESINRLFVSKIDDALIKTLTDNVNNTTLNVSEISEKYSDASVNVLPTEVLTSVEETLNKTTKEEVDNRKTDLKNKIDLLACTEESLKALPEKLSQDDLNKYAKAILSKEVFQHLEKAEKDYEEFGTPPTPSALSLSELHTQMTIDAMNIKRDIGDLKKRATLLQDGVCPLTKGSPCADLLAFTDSSSIDLKIKEKEEALSSINADFVEVNKLLEETQAKERKASEVAKELNYIREQVTKFDDVKDFDINSFEKLKKASEGAETKRNELISNIAVLKNTIAELDKFITDVGEDYITEETLAEAKQLKKTHEEAVIILRELSSQLEAAKKLQAAAKQALTDAELQNARADRGIAIKDILTKVRTILHKDNLPRRLIDSMRDSLNEKQGKFLNWFGFPYKVKWLTGGSLVYVNDVGEDTPVSMLSGGQKYVVLVALRCALMEFLNSNFPFLVLDEPTTGLDVENREALAQVLYKISATMSEKGMYLIIPTHDQALLTNANIVKIGE